MAKNSPLSRWAGQPVLKHLRFQLTLDDPKVAKDQWVTLQGDRVQLTTLCEVVQTYVQYFLEQSHTRLNSLNSAFEPFRIGESALLIATLAHDRVSPPSSNVIPGNSTGIALQPHGLLTHELTLGSLANEESGPAVQLSTLQLFDLANALDDYTNDVLTLPNLQRPGWLKSSPPWAQVAAVALVVVGLSASVAKLMDGSNLASSDAPTTSQGASSSDQKIANQLPPSAAGSPQVSATASPIMPPPPPAGASPSGAAPDAPSSSSGTVVSKLPTVTLPNAAPVTPSRQSSAEQPNRPTQAPAPPTIISQIPADAGQMQLPPAAANRSLAGSEQRESAGNPQSAKQSAAPEPTGTAFDTIPQVAEARRYFQQRWTPPQGLTQTLEYRITIAADGTVQGISPLGQASGDYVDRTGIPLVGESLVSPLKQGRSADIRLVLGSDGSVQTFLEGVK